MRHNSISDFYKNNTPYFGALSFGSNNAFWLQFQVPILADQNFKKRLIFFFASFVLYQKGPALENNYFGSEGAGALSSISHREVSLVSKLISKCLH